MKVLKLILADSTQQRARCLPEKNPFNQTNRKYTHQNPTFGECLCIRTGDMLSCEISSSIGDKIYLYS